jgi:hypothetical protein
MSHWALVVLGWAVTVVVLVAYAAVVLRRGRRLSAEVPPGEQRWL